MDTYGGKAGVGWIGRLGLTYIHYLLCIYWEIPGGWVVKNSHVSEGVTEDGSSIPGPGRSPGGVNGTPLQYSCWYNPMERGACRAAVHGVAVGHDCYLAHTPVYIDN